MSDASHPPSQDAAGAVLDAPRPTIGVVIACFDVNRWGLLTKAIQSVRDQDYPSELTVVVDHNEDLYQRLLIAFPKEISIIQNARSRGAAGARNTAALKSDRTFIAFLDDDAYALSGWLRSLAGALNQPGVVGVGGQILPHWQEGCPRWFPPELGWTIGASIPGTATEQMQVRNVWSGSMMVDRQAFQLVNGFSEVLSKVGGSAQPEDTELCLRISNAYGIEGKWLMVPSALIKHHIPANRATLRYVVRRCWSEGTGKVRMRAMAADPNLALADEKLYLLRTVPRTVGAGVRQSLRQRRPDGFMRSATMMLGVAAAIGGAIAASAGVARPRNGWEKSR